MFIISIIVIITNQFEKRILHLKSASIKEIAFTRASSMIVNVLLTMLTLTRNDNEYNIDLPELLLSLTPVLLFYYSYIIKEAISQFSMSTKHQTASVHKNVATSEIILFFISLKCCFSFDYKKSDYYLLLTMHCITVTILHLENIIRHILFLIDRKNFGNSLSIFRKQNIIDILFLGIHIITEGSFDCFIVYKAKTVSFSVLCLFANPLYNIKLLSKKVKGVIAIGSIADTFPLATKEDIDDNEFCIICRCPLSAEKARKINCGHCFHEECLYRWLVNSETCPICKKTIEFNKKEEEN